MSEAATAAILDDASSEAPGDRRPRAPGTVTAYWRLAGGFWRGRTARRAWLLTTLVAILIIANLSVTYGVNRWNAFFFDALERKEANVVLSGIGLFAVLAVTGAAFTVAQLIARMRLQVYWRQWLTERLAERWLGEQRFYRLSIAAPDVDAPEFRIAEDARIATEPVVDFGTGITNAVLTALVFFGVLWTVGGSTVLFGVEIPGFMVFAAIAYSCVMSGSMLVFGRPLIARIEAKNAAEAQLRTEMVRVRENAESIAMLGGEADETRALRATLKGLVRAWKRQIAQLARMTWMMSANWVVAPVVPLLLEAPNYLSGKLTLGALMQTAAAFVTVQAALNWLFDNYPRIAEWLASAGRVAGLWTAFMRLDASVGNDAGRRIVVGDSPDGNLHLVGLHVEQHNGRVVIDEADIVIAPGDKVLLTGESGTGKSTLIRAIAGLWPWGSGRILLPPGADVAFVPQRTYIPNGKLRHVLLYPAAHETEVPDSALAAALERCGLKRLVQRLDDVDRWDKLLSGGEQQRIAFARLLVHRPSIVIMDEATAALDVPSQDSMMELFRDELATATVISVGHRPELEEYHTRKLSLRRFASEGPSDDDRARRRKLAALLRRTLRPRPSPDPSHPVSN